MLTIEEIEPEPEEKAPGHDLGGNEVSARGHPFGEPGDADRAFGHYDAAKKAFVAEDMLVKCPSKYQEQLDQSQG